MHRNPRERVVLKAASWFTSSSLVAEATGNALKEEGEEIACDTAVQTPFACIQGKILNCMIRSGKGSQPISNIQNDIQ